MTTCEVHAHAHAHRMRTQRHVGFGVCRMVLGIRAG